MLVVLAIIGVVWFAYALSFERIGDAVPKGLSGMFHKPAGQPGNDPS